MSTIGIQVSVSINRIWEKPKCLNAGERKDRVKYWGKPRRELPREYGGKNSKKKKKRSGRGKLFLKGRVFLTTGGISCTNCLRIIREEKMISGKNKFGKKARTVIIFWELKTMGGEGLNVGRE